MRRCTIYVGDPADGESLNRLRESVDKILSDHPEARLTWLQSSASDGKIVGGAAALLEARHVLSCAVEFEDAIRWPGKQPVSTPAKKGKTR